MQGRLKLQCLYVAVENGRVCTFHVPRTLRTKDVTTSYEVQLQLPRVLLVFEAFTVTERDREERFGFRSCSSRLHRSPLTRALDIL